MTILARLPTRITLLACLVLITTVLNVVRLITVFDWRATLETYAPRPGALYIGATGCIWAMAGTIVLWGIWGRASWAMKAALINAFVYAAWVWTDRLAIQSQPRPNWAFSVLATVLLLGGVAAVTLDPRNEAYFMKRNP